MSELTCPDCRHSYEVSGVDGTDNVTCPNCVAVYKAMYIAGFTDGYRARTPDTAPAGEVMRILQQACDSLSEILDYEGGAEHAMADEYVRDRAEIVLGVGRASLTPTEPCGTCGSPDTEREGDTLCCNSCGVVRDRPLGTPTEPGNCPECDHPTVNGRCPSCDARRRT